MPFSHKTEENMYNKAYQLIELTNKNNCRICDIVIQNECKLTEKSEKEIRDVMGGILKVMMEASKKALEKEVCSISGLSGGDAKLQESYRKAGRTICGDIVNKAIARAMSCSEVNAAMGRIVAAPTAGASGIIPAAVITAAEVIGADEDAMIDALFTASGVGQIIAKNATLAGAEGGCQAECGSGSAMAAAALVEMYGGTPQMAFDAAAMAIKSKLGLVCDPVAGLVEIPCIKRNATGAVEAMTCADIALAGVKSMIPFDEVVEAMFRVGKSMPMQLRETALGGLATTPTGLKLNEQVKSGK
ncbi:MAG: sdaAA [Clostridiales bacterium]|nr:sdaAA [Clostridiales bacterium]